MRLAERHGFEVRPGSYSLLKDIIEVRPGIYSLLKNIIAVDPRLQPGDKSFQITGAFRP